MYRTRTSLTASRAYHKNGGDPPGTLKVWETISDSVPGPCSCSHERASLLTGTFSDANTWYTHERTPIFLASDVLSRISGTYSLNWDKLPSSTQTNILGILAEIDDTIGIFTKKFWSSLSYGSFTWGVIPFVSDLQAVAKAVHNLSLDLNSISYEDEYTVISERKDSGGKDDFSYRVEVNFHVQGKINMSNTSPALRALDWIGLHPDLALAWDLIPFSFVVDYLLPIGSYLESYRGWIKQVPLFGWYSCKFEYEPTYYNRWYSRPQSAIMSKGKYYSRVQKTDVLVLNADTGIDPRIPSFSQLFNMVYLATRRS